MKVLSLYCGAGGIDEGLKQAGIKTTLAIDSWKDACETFKLNHPDCEVIQGKVSDYVESINQADIIVGGPPCPEFSRAKLNRSFDMCEVNNFWSIIERCNPRYYLMENVQDIKKKLWKTNYLINAADYGVPQTRLRRFFTNLPRPEPSHIENPQNTLSGNILKKWVSVKDALGLDGLIQNRELTKWKTNSTHLKTTNEPSSTLLTDSSNNGRWFIQDRKTTFGEGFRNYNPEKPMFTQTADTRMYLVNKLSGRSKNGVYEDEYVYARKISNNELAILQGFSNNYKFYGNISSVRRQIGNAVPPPITKAFFQQITLCATIDRNCLT